MYRQGDLLIRKVDKIPDDAKPLSHKVLALGVATGHKHEMAGNATLYEKGSDMWLDVLAEAQLNHNEHDTIAIPEGTYQVIRQREFDGEMIRYVYD